MKKIISILSGLALLITTVLPVLAFDFTMGNTPTDRAVVDTYSNFSIIDTNNSASFDGVVTQIEYYAKNTNPFMFLIVDEGGQVEWKSELITPPAAGVHTYTPSTAPHVQVGWNIGMYFQSTGTIPFDYDAAADPATYEANNAGEPNVGETLSIVGSSDRYYSLMASGWRDLTTPVMNGFLNPTLPCGAITNIHSTTVDWTDSIGGVGGLLGYNYAIHYPTGPSTYSDWSAFFTTSQYTGTLNEGTHTIQVQAKDTVGNVSGWSNECTITADWTAPDVEITNPANGSTVSGVVDIRGTVTDANPHHYWLAIYSGSSIIWSATVNKSDSFEDISLKQWNTSSLTDGDYTIVLAARDSADNRSGNVQVTVTTENDEDNDGVNDNVDNCPIVVNPDQADLDGDDIGDVCDDDIDGDEDLNDDDNCPLVANSDQTNSDTDNLGDACDPDDDNDSVLDGDDFCAETTIDAPYLGLGVNRWAWNGDDWETEYPGGLLAGILNRYQNRKNQKLAGGIADTYGCSCSQILERMAAATGEDFEGHNKFGCSMSIIDDWISGEYYLETVTIPVDASTGINSSHVLNSDYDYKVKAYGTACAEENIPGNCTIYFDPEYSNTPSKDGDAWVDGVTGYSGVNLLDLRLDGGYIDWATEVSPDHVYNTIVNGNGTQLNLSVYDVYYSNNTGNLMADIYAKLW